MGTVWGRVVAFIDGFNMYYALKKGPGLSGYKWLDYRKLCQCVLPRTATLNEVYYFTAYFYWDLAGVKRHKLYVRVLESVGVSPVFGRFKLRHRRCRNCGVVYRRPEEKQTDVNIVVSLCSNAVRDTFDTAVLVTADSDLIPVIRMIHADFPAKRIALFAPPNRPALELKDEADHYSRLKRRHLVEAQFPDKIVLKGGAVLERPEEWT